MQNQNWRFLSKVIAVAAVTVLVVSFSTFAMAQGGDAVHAMFVSAPKEATNIKGVSIIADRPKGFNPLTASSEELGRYGLPQRPDRLADAKRYAMWARAMQALRYRPAAHLEAKPYSSTNLMPAKRQRAARAISGQTLSNSLNWSGVASTNRLTSWDTTPANTSFTTVESFWVVSAAQPPLGACAADPPITGATGVPGFFEVSWNGIDGATNGDVLQGGSLSYAQCGGPAAEYEGWVEWYPSYPILVIWCSPGPEIPPTVSVTPCPVSAGDDFFVVTNGANSTLQYVMVEDLNQGWGATFELTQAPDTPPLVGSSAEWVVERPCCDTTPLPAPEVGYYPLALANYFLTFFDFAIGVDGAGTSFWPGAQTAATEIFTMVDDDGDTTNPISDVLVGGTGFQGQYSILFESAGCANTGGCASK
jgi:hypothetical protein